MDTCGSGGPVTQAIRAMRAAEPILPDPNKAGLDADLRSARLLSRTEVEDLTEPEGTPRKPGDWSDEEMAEFAAKAFAPWDPNDGPPPTLEQWAEGVRTHLF